MIAEENILQSRIPFLLNAEVWPHDVKKIEMLETHISWVFLTGEYAYKIKKPVNFGFVDYESVQKRHAFCKLEIELNRRFAPDLYIGVVPIFVSNGSLLVGDENWEPNDDDPLPIDYAVKMRQFSQDAIVASRLQSSELTRECVEQFGRDIADFHASIESANPSMACVQPTQVINDAKDNFVVLSNFFAIDHRLESIRELELWTQRQSRELEPEFQIRLEQGRVRRCHGDMHLKNIIQLKGRLLAFDGVEFNETFQWVDILNEIAFPVMDFVARGRADLAWRLLNSWLEVSGDYQGLKVLKFYLVYRALVRAKVTCLNPSNTGPQCCNADSSTGQNSDSRSGPWDKYLDVATYFAFDMSPRLAITHGFSGSGKSTIASGQIDRQGGIQIRSDVERHRLARQFPTAEKYSAEMSDRVYDHLLNLADILIQSSFPVVIDATFLERKRRKLFQELAEARGVEFEIINCDAPYEELCRRIRNRGADPSEATIEILDAQMKSHDPLTTEELVFARSVDD